MFSSLKTRLNLTTYAMAVIASISIVYFVNHFQKKYALDIAEEKSTILLQHNLAIHSYFNKQLKPSIFAITDSIRDDDYFDPIWMSSTYAVRGIDKFYRKDKGGSHYYKEAAINSRSPENEADAFERDFILRMNKDQKLNKFSGTRVVDGKPYFFTLIRGESMETGCMRCHSIPDKAPGDLVKAYGPARSFKRSVDEVVSAVSIRIPLELAYREADTFSAKLSIALLILLLTVFAIQNRLLNRLIIVPLYRFRSQAESISSDLDNLGATIPQIYTREMNEIAGSFNNMSSRLRMVVDNLDSTVHKRTAELKESEERFKKLFFEAPLGIALIDSLTGHIHEVNPMFAKIAGRTMEEMSDIDWMSIIHSDDVQENLDNMALLNAGKTKGFQMENRYVHKDGTCVWINMVIAPVDVEGKAHPRHLCMIEDITERRQLDQQFQQTQRLESLGVLAGGIAHDFNNILAIIIGYCALIKMNYNAAEDHIPQIEKAAERAAELCRLMLAYAGKGQMNCTQVNLGTLISEMVHTLKTTVGKNVELKTEISDGGQSMRGDASQIRQIIINLIINAAEAIGGAQGNVLISLAKTAVTGGQADMDHLGKIIPPGEYICLEVTDNGCGMDDETKRRIFEPFYSTKFTGRGLGMSAVLGIITSHGGTLQFFSQPGEGTTFKVYLPIHCVDNADSAL